MEIRKSVVEDLDLIMTIYDRARSFMKQTGNANQWINGYPSRELICQDIERENSYVCLDETNEIIGTFCFMQGEDPTYLKIYEGKWLNDNPYGVVHRMAGTGKTKGFADYCLEWCFNQCGNVRVDTHEDNKVMQHILKKNGYCYCGIIYLQNGSKRIAFQKEQN